MNNSKQQKNSLQKQGVFVFKLFCVNGFIKVETVIFLIESPHMKHEHCFAVKVNCKENKGRNSVDSHCMTGKFNGSCDNIDPHVGDKMMGHMVVAGFVCIFCVVGAHEIEKYTECSFRKKSNKMIKFAPEHNERSSGANHCGHDGKGKAAGFSMEKIKSRSNKKEAEEIKKSSYFVPYKVKRSKHKAHSDDYRKSTFKSELVFFHIIIIPLKSFA